MTSRTSVGRTLALFWTYAAAAGSAAVVLGEAVAAAASDILPIGLGRFLAITTLVVAAGAAQESIVVRLIRRYSGGV